MVKTISILFKFHLGGVFLFHVKTPIDIFHHFGIADVFKACARNHAYIGRINLPGAVKYLYCTKWAKCKQIFVP